MPQADDQKLDVREQFIQKLRQLPQALTPKYSSPLPISPIVLYQGDMTLTANNTTIVEQGTIKLNWYPSLSIDYQIILDRMVAINESPVQVTLKSTSRTLSGYLFQPDIQVNESEGLMRLQGPVMGEYSPGPTFAQRTTFHLVNFHNFAGKNIAYISPDKTSGCRLGRLMFQNEIWKVLIDVIQYDDQIWNELSKTNGYGITHTGALYRIDGNQFLVSEAEDVLEALMYLLALFRGLWVGPILITHEVDDQNEWLDLRLRNTSHWHSSSNWFPKTPKKLDGELDRLFSKFLNLWSVDVWKQALRTIVFWYVESSTSQSAEAGIVSVSTALELLFWIYFVESPETAQFSKSRAEKMSFEEKLAKLLELSKSPEEIPAHFEALRTVAQKFDADFSEGPKVFARLRNSIVHPKQKYRQTLFDIPGFARIQAKQLGLTYLEHTVLHILGYKGHIEPRDKLYELSGGD